MLLNRGIILLALAVALKLLPDGIKYMWEVLKWIMFISYPLGIIISFVGIGIEKISNKKVLTIVFIRSGIAMCIISWVLLAVLITLIQFGFIIN